MGGTLDVTRLSRIRWRCRRGMLENDIVLTRYLDAHGPSMTEADVAQLDALLELPDTELWDIVTGRAEPQDTALSPMVAALRNA